MQEMNSKSGLPKHFSQFEKFELIFARLSILDVF